MKKTIFILTYSEGDRWVEYYNVNDYEKYFPSGEYQIIILDNGNQDVVRDWAIQTNSIYHRSENNLGTTGGYNWFLRVGQLLKAPRIAVLQADVFVHEPTAIKNLFVQYNGIPWDSHDFVYWPNQPRNCWTEGNLCGDVGQFFSLDPNFFIENNYLCDENFTITHFESIDLWRRMTSIFNKYPAIPHNLLNDYYPEEDLVQTEGGKTCKIYTYHSFSNRSGEHDQWFKYNWEYFKKKWAPPTLNIDAKTGYYMFLGGHHIWGLTPWIKTETYLKPGEMSYKSMYVHHRPLDPHRNINVNQMPYPVEYEVNKFYINNLKKNV